MTSQGARLPELGVSGHSFLNVEYIDRHIFVRVNLASCRTSEICLVGSYLSRVLTLSVSAGLIKSDLRRQKANQLAKEAVSVRTNQKLLLSARLLETEQVEKGLFARMRACSQGQLSSRKPFCLFATKLISV